MALMRQHPTMLHNLVLLLPINSTCYMTCGNGLLGAGLSSPKTFSSCYCDITKKWHIFISQTRYKEFWIVKCGWWFWHSDVAKRNSIYTQEPILSVVKAKLPLPAGVLFISRLTHEWLENKETLCSASTWGNICSEHILKGFDTCCYHLIKWYGS